MALTTSTAIRRQAIAFRLVPLESAEDGNEPPAEPNQSLLWTRPLDELRQAALDAPESTEQGSDARQRVWLRSHALRVYVLRRANGACEGCGQPAPFATPDGHPFLEAHHTRRLSDGGPDDPRWVIAICPNCHRRAHYATDATTFNDNIKLKLGDLETAE